MITVNEKESFIEIDEKLDGQTEVNAIAPEGGYHVASFAIRSDAEQFVEMIEADGRNYTVENYRLK